VPVFVRDHILKVSERLSYKPAAVGHKDELVRL